MITVQAADCAPIVKAFESGEKASQMCADAKTIASGLRVPKAYGDYIVLAILRESGGTAVSATDQEMIEAVNQWASGEGVFAAPEGAASLVAYKKLLKSGFLRPQDKVVLFNTGSGLKYLDVLTPESSDRKPLPERRNMGGIIQPM
jgi:threonine synthase